jgi:UDP-N-acetyl-2-amino-2-deoxyglucuronate dehydrogenase
LRADADAICEKPLVLNPWNLDALEELEAETGRRVYTVLQLRVHPTLVALRERMLTGPDGARHSVVLNYVTARGPWYRYSWKGDPEKSGGLATNIGIHLFDLVLWLFGSVRDSIVLMSEWNKMSGRLELERADVQWTLSIDKLDLPAAALAAGQATYRSISVDGLEIEFSEGFTDLHTRVYEEVLVGRGFGIAEARPSIELVRRLRSQC